MGGRIQVIVEEHEKQRFRAAAQRASMSLSSWLKRCAFLALEESETAAPCDIGGLRQFFDQCDAQEEGSEPDWSEQKHIIATSSSSGTTNT